MLKRKILTCLFMGVLCCYAQTKEMEVLHKAIAAHPQQDTMRVNLLNQLGLEARKSTAQEARRAYTEAIDIAKRLGFKHGEAISLLGLGFYYRFNDETKEGLSYTLAALSVFTELKDSVSIIACDYNLAVLYSRVGNFQPALLRGMHGLKLAEQTNNSKWLSLMNYQLGNMFMTVTDSDRAMQYFRKSFTVASTAGDLDGMTHGLSGIGFVHETQHNWDSAIICYQQARRYSEQLHDPRGVLQNQIDIANMYAKAGNASLAYSMIHTAIPQLTALGQIGYLPYCYTVLANLHLNKGNADSALFYGFKVLNAAIRSGRVITRGEMSKVIGAAYAMKGDFKNAYHFQELFSKYSDSLNMNDAIKRSTALQYSSDIDRQQSQINLLTKNEELRAQESRQQKILLFLTLIGLLVVVVFSVVLWRNNRLRVKAYHELQQQQVALRATQAQLIQTEKMASLGELTAGIAHEIQNPLNFVNNFAELNADLIDELKTELANHHPERAIALAADIKDNELKIAHHGKRADAIVKGMLQHSRNSSGIKELTDINALADEYLRLAYHGLRAKDKSFNATMITHYDDSIGMINIISQDIGRVILNLITNAFYAVDEKKKQTGGIFEPTVTVRTKKKDAKVEISVKDNGNGVPAKVLDKIFHPFFTTKPTGQGTGLGLSLSYDIIKAHGGEIKVDTKEGQGSEFIIVLTRN